MAEDFGLDPIFSDNMVFAEGKPMRVFGRGAGEVSVCIGGMTASALAVGGRWLVEFGCAPAAGGPYELEAACGGDRVTLRNVRVGEVWLMAGQSNMAFKLKDESGFPGNAVADAGIAAFVSNQPEAGGEHIAEKGWVVATAATAAEVSAIGYLFARERRAICGKPVGIVGCYQGASTVQSWLPPEVADAPRFRLPAEELHPDHTAEAYFWNKPGVLYGRTFKPIVPFSFTGVVWYQGESNTGKGEARVYADLLAEMIGVWRRDLLDAGLPFILVAIADFRYRDDDAWRAVQRLLLEMPSRSANVKAVACADICENDQIHPPTKSRLARRLANAVD